MTSMARVEANRANAARSTGPRTDLGKQRSALNAVRHGLTGKVLLGLQFGALADDADDVQAFVDAVIEELAPCGEQERAEAIQIAALHIRRRRLLEIEALAIGDATRARTLPPEAPGLPARIPESELTKVGANALSAPLFVHLPRYEGHLSRELDRSMARYARLQEARRWREQAVAGEVIEIAVRDVVP